jgi:hypothetical protein
VYIFLFIKKNHYYNTIKLILLINYFEQLNLIINNYKLNNILLIINNIKNFSHNKVYNICLLTQNLARILIHPHIGKLLSIKFSNILFQPKIY